jgi:hypothetical protein
VHGDKRLNFFEHYAQTDTAPHEKNVPRTLAILLENDPLLLDRFIDWVNENLRASQTDPKDAESIPKPTGLEGREIGFLQSAASLADPENAPMRIVGLTLMPFKPSEPPRPGKAALPAADIAVHFGDDLLLVETQTAPAAERVTELAQSVRALLEQSGEKHPPRVVSPLRATWEDLLCVLEDVHRLEGESERSALGHCLRYLDSRYPQWRRADSFDIARAPLDSLKRVPRLAAGCAYLLAQQYGLSFVPVKTVKYAGAFGGLLWVVPLENFGFAREVELSVEEKNGKFGGVKATLWVANNKEQGFYFFGGEKIRDDLSWTRSVELKAQGGSVGLTIRPYVKFSHILGRYVTQAYCPPEKVDLDRQVVRKKFFEPLARKWTREEWPELRRFLTETHPGLLENPEGLQYEFERLFEKSDRQFTYVNFGYEAILRFPAAELAKLDAQSVGKADGKPDDKAAEWIVNAIGALKAEIEKA